MMKLNEEEGGVMLRRIDAWERKHISSSLRGEMVLSVLHSPFYLDHEGEPSEEPVPFRTMEQVEHAYALYLLKQGG